MNKMPLFYNKEELFFICHVFKSQFASPPTFTNFGRKGSVTNKETLEIHLLDLLKMTRD